MAIYLNSSGREVECLGIIEAEEHEPAMMLVRVISTEYRSRSWVQFDELSADGGLSEIHRAYCKFKEI